MAECTVCCETYNKSSKKKIACCFCDYELCRGCTSTYLVNTTNEPHCMQCKHVWTRDFLGNNLTKKFIDNDLKNHRENILFTREKCLLPESQEYASNVLISRQMKPEIEELCAELHRGYVRLNKMRRDQGTYETGRAPNGVNTKSISTKMFIRQCPSEECKGFLSSAWKCGLCSKNFCAQCNDEKGEAHVCDDDMVKTMKLLKNDTKPCPKCSTMIFKIEGCAQMWCTSCGTAFSWTTGRIEKGVIHNPHYYEMQRNGDFVHRNAGDIPCGGLPSSGELRNAIGVKRDTGGISTIYDCHRFVNHITHHELVFNYVLEDPNNNRLRVEYLLNDITEKEMKKQLQMKDKAYHKMRDWRDLIEMLSHTLSDLFRQLILKEVDIDQFLDHIEKLREYSNREFLTISKRYNCVWKIVTGDWSHIGL